MDANTLAALTDLKALAQETQTALHEQGERFDVIMKLLEQLIDLLRPKSAEGDITLEDLLAHLIKQAGEQIAIARDTLEAVRTLRTLLPEEIAAALKG